MADFEELADEQVLASIVQLQRGDPQLQATLAGLRGSSTLNTQEQEACYQQVLEANLRSCCVARRKQQPTVCPITLQVPEGTGSHIIPKLVLARLKTADVPLFHLGKLRLQNIDRAVFYSYANAAEVAMGLGESTLAQGIDKLINGEAIHLVNRQANLFVYSLFTVAWRTFAMSVPTRTDQQLRALMTRSLFALRSRLLDNNTTMDKDGFISDENDEFWLTLSVAVMPTGAQPFCVPTGAVAVPNEEAYTSCTVLGYLAVFATVSRSRVSCAPRGTIPLNNGPVDLDPAAAFAGWNDMLLLTFGLNDIAQVLQLP